MKIKIHGEKLSNLLEFYDEIEAQLTKGLDWKIGRNLDAFNDVLRGGFGVHEYGSHINLSWVDAQKSKADLGQAETIKYLESILKTCHPTNIERFTADLELVKKGQGETIFDIIVEIINSHKHITLKLL